MRPLPTSHQSTPIAPKPSAPATSIATSQTLELGPLNNPAPTSNRRATDCPIQRAYPWLLISSTALAAVFCGLYLTKPVLVADGRAEHATAAVEGAALSSGEKSLPTGKPKSLLPKSGSLPGDAHKPQATDPRHISSASKTGESTYEETNLRVQHVLKAQGADGADLGKIMLEVPVIYRSRSLRWTPEEVARARKLMTRIVNYQDASRMIREEGQILLTEWNSLIGETIPATVLRADSPSLPTVFQPTVNENLDSTQAIEIQD